MCIIHPKICRKPLSSPQKTVSTSETKSLYQVKWFLPIKSPQEYNIFRGLFQVILVIIEKAFHAKAILDFHSYVIIINSLSSMIKISPHLCLFYIIKQIFLTLYIFIEIFTNRHRSNRIVRLECDTKKLQFFYNCFKFRTIKLN